MKKYNTLELFDNGSLVILKLNRPDKRNALNPEMISELKDVFKFLATESEAVILKLMANGASFCAGADIQWLKSLQEADEKYIVQAFSELGKMLDMLKNLPQITLAIVHGSAYGGGVGLFSVCDYIICEPDTTFSFSEIKLGLVPATIAPYVVERIGIPAMKKLFLTGERFDENYAERIALIDKVATPNMHAANQQTIVELILSQPRHAVKEMKQLFRKVENGEISSSNYRASSKIIARLMRTKETKILFNKFLKGGRT